jgi:deoxyribose-phosphate aldolase
MHTGCTRVCPVCLRCTSGVPPVYTTFSAAEPPGAEASSPGDGPRRQQTRRGARGTPCGRGAWSWQTDRELEDGCKLAARYDVAAVCIKPYYVKRAAELLRGTGVNVGAVIGFPHGGSTTEVKRYETEVACRDGATEIDMVINIGKALSGDWDYVGRDIRVVCDEAHGHGARVKVIFENDYLANGGAGLNGDELKRKLCQISERAGADWVKTSTGYGFVKGPDGKYSYKGATESDLKLMRASVSSKVQVKAAGGVRDLDGLILACELGCTRCGATATAAMLDEFKKRAGVQTAARSDPTQAQPLDTVLLGHELRG